MKIVLFFVLLLAPAVCFSQAATKKLYLLRPQTMNGSAIKMKLLVNGHPVVLRCKTLLEIPLTGDSIKIEVLNKRFRKRSQVIHMGALDETYFSATFSSAATNRFRSVIALTQTANDACFEQERKRCKVLRTAAL